LIQRGHVQIYGTMLILFGVSIMYGQSLEAKISQLESRVAVVQDVVGSNQKRLGDVEDRVAAIEKKEAEDAAAAAKQTESSFADKVKKFFTPQPVQPAPPASIPIFP
jgi:peptidoglycan hydrolase CwlO-like protein